MLKRREFSVSIISEFFQNLLAGFARLIITSLVIWMIGLIILLFNELFSTEDFKIKVYLGRVWRLLRRTFEWTAYLGVFAGLIMAKVTEETYAYIMMSVSALILSIFYLSIRKQTRAGRKMSDPSKQPRAD